MAVLASEARLTETSVAIVIINTLAIILTGRVGTVINVDVTVRSRPARLTDTLISEQLVHTLASDTGVWVTQVHLLLTPLASEASGTVTAEVIDQVSTVGSQQAGLLQTVIDVLLTVSSLPAIRTLASVSALGKGSAGGIIGTGISILRAGVSGDVTVVSLESIPAQTLKVVGSRQVLAHGSLRAGTLHTVRDLILTLETSEALRTLTSVSLRIVHTGGSIVARSAGTLIHIHLTVLASEASWAVALGVVSDGSAQSSMLTEVIAALD